MKQLPIGIQTFEHLITGDFLYVDKTRHIYELIKPASARYFLSRPRRFGKSLLVTTLKAIFEGKRGLFDGLAIADMPYDWEAYPVIHLDLSGKKVDTADDLTTYLCNQINLIATQYDIQLEWESYEERFAELIRKLAASNRVVILIDEYDKPILDNIGRTEQVKEIKDTLSAFYGIIKASDEYLHFVLLTGVSKFSKVSIFSKLNNLNDLTMTADYADMLGYTQAELEDYFQEHLSLACRQSDLTMQALLEKIEHWYNGYRFSTRDIKVYNPISTMLMLQNREFKSYWFETGTPTFLIDLIKSRRFDLRELKEFYAGKEAFSTFEVENLEIEPLLVQTGYLTIKDYSPESRIYTLSYPNYEVESAFTRRLLSASLPLS
ncbi:MAG: AAA family ATPase [bacterium]|nr:AAA family ATPase [bacterium]